MFKEFFIYTLASQLLIQTFVSSHCQLPCGIYHDEMVFDQIDQYVETMVKAISVLNEDNYKTVQDHNVSTRWIMLKESGSNEVADIITTYFLQQKIKPDEADTTKKVLSAHKMLFSLVKIKQMVDLKFLNDFYEEWEKFKLMFHIEGYKCKVSQKKLEKMKQKTQENSEPTSTHTHTHDDDHHDHTH